MSEANTPFFAPPCTTLPLSTVVFQYYLFYWILPSAMDIWWISWANAAMPSPPPSFFLQTTVGNAEVKPLEELVHAVRLLSAWLYQKYIYRVSSTRWLEWLL